MSIRGTAIRLHRGGAITEEGIRAARARDRRRLSGDDDHVSSRRRPRLHQRGSRRNNMAVLRERKAIDGRARTLHARREVKELAMSLYMLLLYDDPKQWAKISPDEMQKAIEKYRAWRTKPFTKDSNRLGDDAGRVIRSANGKARIVDGPYSET